MPTPAVWAKTCPVALAVPEYTETWKQSGGDLQRLGSLGLDPVYLSAIGKIIQEISQGSDSE